MRSRLLYSRVAKPPPLILYRLPGCGSTTGSDYLTYTSHGVVLNTTIILTYTISLVIYPTLCYQPLRPPVCPLHVLKRFNVEDATPVYSPMDHVLLDNQDCEDEPADKITYLSIVGSLTFAALGTRPDISYHVTALSHYNVLPLQMHLTAAKRALRYLGTTCTMGPHFPSLINAVPPPEATSNTNIGLHGFTNPDWAGRTTTRKPIGGCIFIDGGPINWQAKSQSVVALSTLEAEYIACSHATREATWPRHLRNTMPSMNPENKSPVPIGCDNQGALKLINTGTMKAKTKHIDGKLHHVHEQKTAAFTYVNTIQTATRVTY